jgi:hypothetical protein
VPGRLHVTATCLEGSRPSGYDCFHEPSSFTFQCHTTDFSCVQNTLWYKCTDNASGLRHAPLPKSRPQLTMDVLTALTMQSLPSWSPSPLPLFSSLSSSDDSSTNTSPDVFLGCRYGSALEFVIGGTINQHHLCPHNLPQLRLWHCNKRPSHNILQYAVDVNGNVSTQAVPIEPETGLLPPIASCNLVHRHRPRVQFNWTGPCQL